MIDDWAKIDSHTLDFRVPTFNESINNPLQAAIEAVNDIVENYPSPYNLIVSGGIDSQAMIYAWKMSKKPFNICSFRYNETYNWHDIKTLVDFCNIHDLTYDIIDVDYFKFLHEDYDAIAKRYKCSSPQISMHIKMASYFKEQTCIYSGNFLQAVAAELTYAMMGIYRFSKTEEGKNTIPYFFLHTPELAYSFQKLDRFPDHPDAYQHKSTYDIRLNKYHLGGFPVIPQERKYTGFEKFKEHYDSHDHVLKDIKNRLKYYMKPSHRPFDWIFRYPYEEIFGDPTLTYILNPPQENYHETY